MKASHIFKFLDSIVGETTKEFYRGDIQKGAWEGTIENWRIALDLQIPQRDGRDKPNECRVELSKEFIIKDLHTGNQTFAGELREAATVLIRMAEQTEAALRETA